MPSEPQQHGTMSRDRTAQRLGRVAILSVLCSLLPVAPTAGGEQSPPDIEHPLPVHSEAWWREQAAKHIEQIADDQARGRAIHNFTWVRVRAGDLEGARAAAPWIGNTQLRVFAHLAIAKHYKLRGDMNACLEELERARPIALADNGRYQMVDAYLDYAESIELATSFVTSIEDRSSRTYRMQFLAEALAKRGQLEEGLSVVNKYVPSKRQQTLAGMARASGTRARIEQVEKLTAILTSVERRDAAWKNLIDQLARENRQEEAKQYVSRISDAVLRAQANAAIGQVDGQPVAEVSADALRKQIENASTREEKSVLQGTLLKKLLAEGNVAAATQVIESMVETIRAFPREPQASKFGTADDETAIALARANYLAVAKLHAKHGDEEASRAAFEKGRRAIVEMPDSAGLGKMLVLPRLIQAHSELGDQDGVRETLKAVKPLYSTMISGHSAVAFIRHGDAQAGMEIADSILSAGRPSREIGEIAAELVHSGESDAARGILARVGDGQHDVDVFREFGGGMIALGHGGELHAWLDKFSPVARAHACIGAAGALAERVGRPAASDEERAVVEYLTIPPESLPAGYTLELAHVPPDSTTTANPGVYPKKSLPRAIEHFQSHRRGSFVHLESAYRAIYRHDELGGDIMIQGFTFHDADTAQRIQDQMYVRGFVDWYFRKGRMLFFVSHRGTTVASARDAIQHFLEERESPQTPGLSLNCRR